MAEVRLHEAQPRTVAILLGLYATAVAVAPKPHLAVVLGILPIGVLAVWWIIQSPSRWVGLLLFSCILLPPLNLPIGNAGPHPALLIAAVGACVGVLRLHEWTSRWDPLSLSLVLFLGVLLATVPAAAYFSGVEIALGSLARVVLFGISVYVFLFVRNSRSLDLLPLKKIVRWLLWAATAASVFACLDFYFQFPAPAGFGPQFIWLETGVFRRAQGFFYEASTLGNFCVFFLVLIVLTMFKPSDQRPASRILLLSSGAVLGTALILSYSRASLANLAVAIAAVAWFHRRARPVGSLVRGVAIFAAAGACVLYLLFPAFAQMYWTRLALSAEFFLSAPNRVLSGRLHAWQQLAGAIADNPTIMLHGIGYKTLPYTSYFGEGIVADNMYLSLLIETGIIGIAAFALLTWNMLRASLNAAHSRSASTAFLGLWFFSFWLGELVQMLSGDLLTYWRVLPVYLFILALSQRDTLRMR
jgi:O-antigen ligase